MSTIKLIVEYDGSRYAGWQRQPDQPTIQQAIETAIKQLTQLDVSVIGAGRTDAGVHALGQVVSFRIAKNWTPAEWTKGLNARLPEDIAVRSSAIMSDEFHARYGAKGKLYRYRILNRPERPAVDRAYLWHIYQPLTVERIQKAAMHLIGTHDFSSFEGSLTDNEDPMCRLERLTISKEGDLLLVEVYADRFLKQMVRTIVGTLAEIGRAKREPDEMVTILRSKDRTKAGRTAPPHGLFLVRVDY